MRACFMIARVRTPSSPVREREKKREAERERERESKKEGENEERLECGHALCLQGCAHPLHWSERERWKEIKRERERERERESIYFLKE